MPCKTKASPEEMLDQIASYLYQGVTITQAAENLHMSRITFRKWVLRYKEEGFKGLRPRQHLSYYSNQMKIQAVKEYLKGGVSMLSVCAKYRISGTLSLKIWIEAYNEHKLTDLVSEGGDLMGKRQQSVKEERVRIVQECIASGCDYNKIAKKYNMSYQTLYTWVKKFKEMGEVGLEDYRGKPIRLQTPRTEEERLRQENARLFEEKKDLIAEIALLKKNGDRGKVAFLEGFSLTHLLRDFKAIKEVHEETNISIESLCRLSKVSRAAYYGWLNHIKSGRELLREKVAQEVVKIHQEYPDMGYRRMNDWIKKYSESHLMVSDSLVLRVRRILNIKSVIKYKTDGCTRNAKDPKYIFENLLNRDFDAGVSNARWMTDVTEFKYTTADGVLHKLYLSAIIDGHDRRIVSYVIGDRNNTALAFETMEKALKENPGAHPMIHTDRGFQYTSNGFHKIVEKAGLVHSMSRVGCCADNGLMEGFWGMLKRERYYTRKFTSRKAVVSMINGYIYFYNNKRIQRKLHLLAPMEVFNAAPMAA